MNKKYKGIPRLVLSAIAAVLLFFTWVKFEANIIPGYYTEEADVAGIYLILPIIVPAFLIILSLITLKKGSGRKIFLVSSVVGVILAIISRIACMHLLFDGKDAEVDIDKSSGFGFWATLVVYVILFIVVDVEDMPDNDDVTVPTRLVEEKNASEAKKDTLPKKNNEKQNDDPRKVVAEALLKIYKDDRDYNLKVLKRVGTKSHVFKWLTHCILDEDYDKEYVLRVAGYYSEYSKRDIEDVKKDVTNTVQSTNDRSADFLKKLLKTIYDDDSQFIREVFLITGHHDTYEELINEITHSVVDGQLISKGDVLEMACSH